MTDPIPPTIEWRAGAVRLVDQRRLPAALEFLECAAVPELVGAIRSLAVRGAPALGVAGAFGVVLAASEPADFDAAVASLRAARPTAVNLAWGVDRAVDAYRAGGADAALRCALDLAASDVAANRAIGAHGEAVRSAQVDFLALARRIAVGCGATLR